MNDIKDYHESFALWQDFVIQGDLIYPNENVARFIFKNKFTSALDFGCGTGRHLDVFLRAGIKTIIGVDINELPLKKSFERFNENATKAKAELILLNNKNKTLKQLLPTTKVDAIVSWGILFLYTPQIAQNLLKEFKSILNKNGKICVNFISVNDGLKTQSIQISQNLYKATRASHKDLLFSFYDEALIDEIFKQVGLKITSIDKEIYTRDNGSEYNEFLVVQAVNEIS